MPAPKNKFKQALKDGQQLIGFWMSLASPYTAEVCASTGYDFLTVDGEHSPVDMPIFLSLLQAVAPYGAPPVVRPPIGETYMIKQLLDMGAQNILIPIVETADQAKRLVEAVRYPPRGVRGVAAATRAARFGTIPDYLATADDEICLLLQVETRKGFDNFDAILAVEGYDGVFIGPSDTAAALGHLGNPMHPDVQKAIEESIIAIRQAGKAPGSLMVNEPAARRYLELGAQFVSVGTDLGILAGGVQSLAERFGVRRNPVS